MDIVCHCHIDFWETPRQRQRVAKLENRFLEKERHIVDIQIQEFLQKGIISCSIFQEEQIISPIFLRPKPDGSHRVIFNQKSLNDSVVYQHFKLDTLEKAIQPSPGVLYGVFRFERRLLLGPYSPRTTALSKVSMERGFVPIPMSPYGPDIVPTSFH